MPFGFAAAAPLATAAEAAAAVGCAAAAPAVAAPVGAAAAPADVALVGLAEGAGALHAAISPGTSTAPPATTRIKSRRFTPSNAIERPAPKGSNLVPQEYPAAPSSRLD